MVNNRKGTGLMAKWIWLVGLTVAAAGLCAAEEGAVTIVLQQQTEIATEQIALGQIAALSGPQEQTEKLATVTLGPAPIAGYQRSLKVGCIKLRLRRMGWDPEEFTFKGAEQTIVTRKRPRQPQSTTLSGDDERSRGEGPPKIGVQRGDKVRIILKYKAITVITAGQVMQQAARDELVEVRIAGSSDAIYAQVTGPHTVEVQL